MSRSNPGQHRIFILSVISMVIAIGIFSATANGEEVNPYKHKIPFVYYLQNLDKHLLASMNPAISVVDPYDSGLTSQDIADLRNIYGQQVFAYISAGEVDPSRTNPDDGYRFNPEWENADWYNALPIEVKSNERWATRRIAYWSDEWHSIMKERALKMLKMGYNGVMLDTVDSFNVLMKPYEGIRDPRQDMADLIGDLRDATKAVDPHFKIMINGGMELYNTRYSKTNEPFLDLIGGQLKEDTWHNEEGSAAAPWTPYDLDYLQQAIDHGVMVLSIDYFTNDEIQEADRKRIKEYFDTAIEFGVVPYAADRDLGKFLDENRQYFSRKENWKKFARHGIEP